MEEMLQPENFTTFEKLEINSLARVFYMLNGYKVEGGYRFQDARHPQEKLMWRMAALAYLRFGENKEQEEE